MAKKRLNISNMVGDIKKPIEFGAAAPSAPEPTPAPESVPIPETPAPEAKKGGRKKLAADKIKGSRLSVYLTADVYAQLSAIAEREGDSLNRIASKAIIKYCKEM